MSYAKPQQYPEALEALAPAEKTNPGWAPTFNYRAKIRFRQNDYAAAVADYRRALALDPTLADAREELARVESVQMRAGH